MKEMCEWSWLDHAGYWLTECGRSYKQHTDDPAEIELMGYCPYCGLPMDRNGVHASKEVIEVETVALPS